MRQTIQVDVLTTSEATVVEVRGGTYLESNPVYVAQGYAKKHPNDTHDAEVGHSLAMARALRDLAEAYEKRAWDRINRPVNPNYAMGGVIKPFSTTATTYPYDAQWLDKFLGKDIKKA